MDGSQLSSVAALIAHGERSVVEVLTEALSRLDEIEALNAVAWRNDDAVMRLAAMADGALSRGDSLGPLHGVPITVKDWIDVAGFPCAGEDLSNAGRRPERDATVVKQLRSAGAIVIAKSNVDSLHGVAHNPWDFSRTAGRSSSGEAITVATGASFVGVGSDETGSLRFPAHCTGIATIKPTLGRVSTAGHFPPVDVFTDRRTVIGPMCRSVADLRTALGVISGPDGIHPDVPPMPLVQREKRKAWRVLVHADRDIVPIPEVDDMVQRAADVLADAGHIVTESNVLHPHRSLGIAQRLWNDPPPNGQDNERLLGDWQTFRQEAFHQMADQDMILSPAAPYAAPRIGRDSYTDTTYTRAPSLWGYPAAVVRFGTSNNGLPLGLQIVAKAWEDDLALSVAESLEDTTENWPNALDTMQSDHP